ncbi:hypothetical protein [Rhizobium sp. NFR03]|uniref:hypothetical protein n=1 Tax=Rhizobium sp. NFR03 TaxID=1566263 RepID=UPI0008D8B40A|nr:hypothetical protein [Rhizobium sp. NFR03]SER57479.1 hypothetical protein SAMN03159406_00531 [Rhizobium sp. NFR03]
MSDAMTISAAAQLREAENQLAYFRGRVAVLAQHIIDRDQLLQNAKQAVDEASAREIEMNAQIVELQDKLRVATAKKTPAKGAANGE